jgi:endonuclease-3 related protein
MMLGAVLTQNTSWRQVERALQQLKDLTPLTPRAILNLPPSALAEAIRPAGYFNQKTRSIREMAEHILRFGSIPALFRMETAPLRKELLSWRGIGPETADSILLYAANRPVFVIDAYTRRMLSRHGLCDPKLPYETAARMFHDQLPEDPRLFNEYHALIVRLGKEHCRAKPSCENCPLAPCPNPPTR